MAKLFHINEDPWGTNEAYETEDYLLQFIFNNPDRIDWECFLEISYEYKMNERVMQVLPMNSIQDIVLRHYIEQRLKKVGKSIQISYEYLIKSISAIISIGKH